MIILQKIKSFSNMGTYISGVFFLLMFSPAMFQLNFSDDGASYVSHAFTLGLDGDLDYTNEPVDQFSRNELLPRHPIGSGILAAPFVAIFSVIDRIIDHPIIGNHNNYLGSWSLFGFVFSVNLLFFMAIFLYIKSFRLLKILNKELWLIILIVFSSTIPHFVLKRYFFSHGFEFFSISLLFWSIASLHHNTLESKSKRLYYCLFGVFLSLNIFVRYSNINLLLVAPIVFLIMDYLRTGDDKKMLTKNNYNTIKIISLISVVSILPNILFYKFYYGSFIPLPSKIYNNDFGLESGSIIETLGIIFNRLPFIVNIIFGSEMGLLYTNPIIPIGFVAIIMTIINISRKRDTNLYHTSFLIILILIFYGFGFSIHLWWQEMASSYGYRYLLQLLPVAILGALIFWNYLKKNNTQYLQYFKRIMIIFSTISIVSLVFYSATDKLHLSEKVNTFGISKTYSGNGFMLNLPLEMVKPYTWLRLLGKSSLGFLVSPIIAKYYLINNGLAPPLFKSKKTREKLSEDIKKYVDRSKHFNFNNISQLLILLFLWVFAGTAFQKYNKMIIYEQN